MLTRLLVPLLAVLVAGIPTTQAAQAGDTTTIRPAALERGEGPRVPQALGTSILDADLRIAVDANEVHLLGTSGKDYVVLAHPDGPARVQRVAADGSSTTVRDRVRGDVVLSRDGLLLLETVVRPTGRSVVTVRDAHTGALQLRRAFRGVVRVLDADEERAVLGGTAPARTFWWHTRTGGTQRISAREGYFADIRADRVATLTGNPYEGGCSVLAPLHRPRRTLWRSCERAVTAVNPRGSRVATMHVLGDGPIALVTVHRASGEVLARYRTPGWFGPSTWESNRSLLLRVDSERGSTLVRCVLEACERASARS